MPRLDYFLLLLTSNQLSQVTLYTSQQLAKHGDKVTTNGEINKWLAIIILATYFEFGDRVSLWSTVSK